MARYLLIFNKKNRVIENVAVMGLNVQPENVLSKEERKARLGGKEDPKCYAECRGGSWYVKSCDPYDTRPVCDSYPVEYCWCWGEN